MYAVVVTFHIEPKQFDSFVEHMRINAQASRDTEPGCHQFDICTDPDHPNQMFLYELYTDKAAFDAHTETDHFHAFNAACGDMIVDKDVRFFNSVQQ